jgi:anti-anti-sigma factor
MSNQQTSVRVDLSTILSSRVDAAKKRLHIEIKEEVTSTTVPDLRRGMKEILDKSDTGKWDSLYLDMRSSRVVDSMGINWLFAESVRLKELKKQIVIRISSPAIDRVMRFAGLDKLVLLKYRRRKQTR